MNNQYTIIPSRLQFKSAPIVDQVISIDLNQTQEELIQFVRNTSISLPQLYEDERQACFTFRPTFKVQYVYDNTLTGTTEYKSFKDNLFYVDAVNSVGSGIWKGFPQYYEFDFYREQVNDRHFAFSPQSAYTYNWTYYLTYPAENDGSIPMSVNYQNQTINWSAQEGIPFIISNSFQGSQALLKFSGPKANHPESKGDDALQKDGLKITIANVPPGAKFKMLVIELVVIVVPVFSAYLEHDNRREFAAIEIAITNSKVPAQTLSYSYDVCHLRSQDQKRIRFFPSI